MSSWRESFRALNHRDFRLYTAGQIVSLTGSWMQGVAQSWLIYRLTHSEFMMGAVMFATHIPVLLLGPLGGMAADRFPRQRIVLITQTLALLQALTLALLNSTGLITPKIVLMLAAVLGIANAFDIPGRQTLFIQMVGKQDLISAISLNSAIFNASRVVGPSLAGIIVAAFGETVCFGINAVSFIAMIVCVAAMHLPKASTTPSEGQGGFKEGFLYAWSHRELRALLAICGLTGLCYAPILALAPFFADGIFHKGSAGLGFLIGSMGIGAVIGVVRLARHTGISDLPQVSLQSALILGLSLLGFGVSPWFGVSMGLMTLIGFSVMRQNSSSNSLIQYTVPDQYRGRMMALFSMVVTGLLPIGSLASGALAEAFGARAVVIAASLCCLAGALALRFAMPGFSRWVKQHEEEACAA
ncbi:MAG: MFS transporter [Bryobacteraceae bacterium]